MENAVYVRGGNYGLPATSMPCPKKRPKCFL